MWEPQFGLADRGWRIIAPEFAMDAVRLNATATTVTMDTYAGEVIDLLDALHVEGTAADGGGHRTLLPANDPRCGGGEE